ncbi:MerR family transcriptional regulator [Brucella intermedia]|uniref:MerR family transcriptional regulator n=1 Tax=Brucella intermedia TaxID=94625 RepID=UPI00224A5683|nr:MerR family transcriptional regulator [Brucella intermedia]
MKIGELAERSGLAPSRIRFYERIGLLTTVDRRPNGYRTYPPEAVVVLDLITTAQKAGFSLDEIRALLPGDLEQWEHGALIKALRRKVADIESLQSRLMQSKAQLVALIGEIEAKPGDIDCAANARRVLTRMMDGTMESPTLATGDVKLLTKGERDRSVSRGA